MVTPGSSTAAPRSYAILGTGALGGYYGACLQRGGLTVHFLLRSDYHHVRDRGLTVKSVAGDFSLPQVHAYSRVEEMPPVDVVVIALKTTQNHCLQTLLPPLLKPDTIILLLQNGLDIEAEVAAIAPQHVLLSGLCFICSNKVGPGAIHHLDYGSVLLGAYHRDNLPGGITAEMDAIAADFKAADIAIDLAEDLYLARWRKLVWNIPFNGLSVVLNATTTEMMESDAARSLAAALMAEVVQAANACGDRVASGENRHLPPDLIENMLEHTAQMKPYRTSMKIDHDEGRPLEIKAIFDNPIKAAQQAGVAVPRIEMLAQQLRFLDQRRKLA
ncbi:MAG: putative 2-dehydropantoate 2-reductase [Cyanobacteria bacterium P01_H01_bin.119]